ncbi:MAG: histidine kinase [Pseudomonadota bacterium]
MTENRNEQGIPPDMVETTLKTRLPLPGNSADKAAQIASRRGKQGPFLRVDEVENEGRPTLPKLPKAETTRRTMNWFFADKNRLFWTFQVVGWLGFFLLHLLTAAAQTFDGIRVSAIPFSFASAAVGFIFSSIFLRPIYRFARHQAPPLLLTITIVSSAIMALIMSAFKAPIYIVILGDTWVIDRIAEFGTDNFLRLLLPDLPVNIFLILTWAGFYFGINYYLALRDETERALFSARLADQAQLKMLRYQLNPHFLFNTLNAISTLVLVDERKDANEMLTKLSAFLRYSLDSDPLQKTTLADEIKALKLYLDIEKTRFSDRLSVVFDVDTDVLDAQVPSLILQPAIENAIKYAIGVMEEGGEIRIVAQRENDELFMRVCDNGPKTPENPMTMLNSATGVGVINMRDRLNHLYGEHQTFKLSRLTPAGLCVSITIPFEVKE